MNDKGKIGIVIVNYCGVSDATECIKSIKKSTCKNYEIIVVDNGSPDDSLEKLNSISNITVIPTGFNGGFSFGNNIGIRYALEHNAEYVLLLNTDIEIAPDMIDKLLADCDECTVTIPKMYYYDRPTTIWYAGGCLDKRKCVTCHVGIDKDDNEIYSVKMETEYAAMTATMLHKSVFDVAGYLDEDYFMYWEDVDYSMTLQKNGIRILFVPDAKLWHKVSQSSGLNSKFFTYYYFRNRLIFIKKHKYNSLMSSLYTLYKFLRQYIGGGIIKRNNSIVVKYAMIDYLKGRKGKSDRF